MPTRRRRESKTELYHIIVKGINRERIFNQQREKIYFKRIILKHLDVINVEIYCYCIMSNHAHFIIRAEIHDLSRLWRLFYLNMRHIIILSITGMVMFFRTDSLANVLKTKDISGLV